MMAKTKVGAAGDVPVVIPARLYTSLPPAVRDDLNVLKKLPQVTYSGRMSELASRLALIFASEKPFEDKRWTWERPPGYYLYRDGIRMQSPDWVSFIVALEDLPVDDGVLRADDIHKTLRAIAKSEVPPVSSRDSGMSTLTYSMFNWATTVRFAKAIQSARGVQEKIQVPSLAAFSGMVSAERKSH